jgi:lysyl-tRNA synthetase class 2
MADWRQRLQTRASVVAAIRRFFDDLGFVEVDTPVALTAVAPELHIDAPVVEIGAGTGSERRFLQTSPELPMKRLLAAGLERIYQIAPVFRDGDLSERHRPEFRLLEWYRRDAPWTALLDDCERLLRCCARAAGLGSVLLCGGSAIDLDAPFRRLTVDQAFREHAGFSVLEALQPDQLRRQLTRLDVHFAASDSWDDLFHRLFLTRVEPRILEDPRPVFLTHYPAPLAALARLSPEDPRTSERFELFACGLELANGFGELTDPTEQRQRFERDRHRRVAEGRRDVPIDERFLAALGDLPPSAGIALGLERLLMLLLDVDNIDAVAFIPWGDA